MSEMAGFRGGTGLAPVWVWDCGDGCESADGSDGCVGLRVLPEQGGGLTRREVQLVRLLGEGLTNAEIVERFAISVWTVKWHLTRAYAKLGVRTAAGAVGEAYRRGLLGD